MPDIEEVKEEVKEEVPAAPRQQFVVMMPLPDGSVGIKLEGVDMEEARRIVSHGYAKFEKEYELHVRRTVK